MPTSREKWTWQCDRVIPSDTAVGRRLLDDVLGQLETQRWARHDIFGSGGARRRAAQLDVPFLGELPIRTELRVQADEGHAGASLDDPVDKS